jgi:hypothetical protein
MLLEFDACIKSYMDAWHSMPECVYEDFSNSIEWIEYGDIALSVKLCY